MSVRLDAEIIRLSGPCGAADAERAGPARCGSGLKQAARMQRRAQHGVGPEHPKPKAGQQQQRGQRRHAGAFSSITVSFV